MVEKIKSEKPYLRVVKYPEPESKYPAVNPPKKEAAGKTIMPEQPARYLKAKKHDCL